MSIFLLTNDDGVTSPFLNPFQTALRELPQCRELRVVVPDREQSWIAQAISRFDPIRVHKHSFDGIDGFATSGTPADCASLGIFNLYDSPPSYVFSGINMGINAGLAFFLSSGTVGGATEAMLAGIRSAAFSAEIPGHLFGKWRSGDEGAIEELSEAWSRISLVAAEVASFLIEQDAWKLASFYSVNIPWNASQDSEKVITQLSQAYFGRLFSKLEDDVFQHRHEDLVLVGSAPEWETSLSFGASFREQAPIEHPAPVESVPGDIETIAQGKISITPVTHQFSANATAVASALGINPA